MDDFLTSNRMLVAGVSAALGAICVALTGITASWWPLIVLGAGLVGYLLTPPSKQQQYIDQRDNEVDALVSDAKDLMRQARRKLPEQAAKRVEHIVGIIRHLAPELGVGAKAAAHLPALESVVTHYLPETIERYVAIPPQYRSLKRSDGSSATTMLVTQLDGLRAKLAQLDHSVAQDRLDELEQHGRYLESAYLKPADLGDLDLEHFRAILRADTDERESQRRTKRRGTQRRRHRN